MIASITEFIHSFKFLKKNSKYIALSALFDSLFLIIFGVGSSFFSAQSSKPIQSLVEAGGRLATQISDAATNGGSPLNVFLADPTVGTSLRTIIFAFSFLLIITYIIWVLFGGATWYLSYQMLDQKGLIKRISYIVKFSLVSMTWFISYAILLALVLRFVGVALLRPDQLVSSNFILNGVNIVNYVLLYFVFFSLALVPFTTVRQNFKMTFKKGITELFTLLPTYAIIFGVFWLNFKLTYFLFEPILKNATVLTVPLTFVILIRFLLAAPFLTWARIYIMLVTNKIVINTKKN